MSMYKSAIATFLMAAFVIFGSASSAYAQCGNGQLNNTEVCDNDGANNTQAVGCCAAGCQTFVAAATTCRAAAGVCDTVAETCTGTSGACPADQLSASTVVCRPSSGAVCDSAENCTGTSGACPSDTFALSSVVCRAGGGVCDIAENCTGTSGACPADAKSTAVCRADSGVCDPGAETCNGSTNDCPADSFTVGGTLCRSSVGVCDPQEVCTGSASTCPDDAKSTAVCRGTTGVCDPAESCNGSTNDCPADAKSTSQCREAAGVCDVAETCDGTAGACPADAKSTAVCRADSGVCDPGAETCNGTNNDCPADSFSAPGTLCRTSVGACDLQEVCTGTTSTCPVDAKSSAVCRASAGVCDVAESCDGTGNSCPADLKSTAVCRPLVNPVCDVAESCDGTNAACPDDVLVMCADADTVSCTEATCDPIDGCVIADNCVEICRSAGFWQTHSGFERGANIGGEVLGDLGTTNTMNVCGQEITETTFLGDLNSSLEGLCVRTQGVKNRQLYRQLVATAFNCAISEGGSCDDVLDGFIDLSFTECSEVCEDGVTAGGPTVNECKEQLGCFNGGGRWIEDQCARGTCEVDTDEYCGADYGDCPLVAGQAQDCVRFADSCAKADLCSEGLDAPAEICPKPGPASSPKKCNEARHNDCTIDDCP